MTIPNLMKIAESSQDRWKTGEKEKLLVMSNFSFSCSVFKRLVLQTREKPGIVWERVNMIENIVGNGENSGHKNFLLFPKCFNHSVTNPNINVPLICWQTTSDWTSLKFSCSVNHIFVKEKMTYVKECVGDSKRKNIFGKLKIIMRTISDCLAKFSD